MYIKIKKIFFIVLMLPLSTFGNGFDHIVTYNFGMVNHSPTENESSLEQTDTTVTTQEEEVSSVTPASAISFQLNWEFMTKEKTSYFSKVTVPLMTTDGAGVFLGGMGINWYLNDLGTKFKYNSNGSEMVIIPKLKYYWGTSAGIGYLIYNTESAKKSDVFFDIGVHGGGAWAWGDNKAIRGEISASRATGVATTGIKFNIFFGVSYYL